MSTITIAMDARQTAQFHTRTDLIEVAAVAVDDNDRLVTGIAKAEFVLREDGRVVPIATFVPVVADGPRDEQSSRFVLLLLDDLVAPPFLAANIQKIARMFADRMGRHDVMAVVPLNGGQGSTSTSIDDVRAAIDKFRPFGRTIMTRVSEQALHTIADLASQMADVKHRRKTLVYIGASSIFDPTELWGGTAMCDMAPSGRIRCDLRGRPTSVSMRSIPMD